MSDVEYPPKVADGLVYSRGLHLWDMGIGGEEAFMLEATPAGVAVSVGSGHGRRVLGYVSTDELRAFVDYADRVCWHCGRARERMGGDPS